MDGEMYVNLALKKSVKFIMTLYFVKVLIHKDLKLLEFNEYRIISIITGTR